MFDWFYEVSYCLHFKVIIDCDVIPKHFDCSTRQDRKQGQGNTTHIQILRLVQYLTIHSEDHSPKGSTYNVYSQMRKTRKIMRFLRTLEHTTAIRKLVGEFTKGKQSLPEYILKVLVIL